MPSPSLKRANYLLWSKSDVAFVSIAAIDTTKKWFCPTPLTP